MSAARGESQKKKGKKVTSGGENVTTKVHFRHEKQRESAFLDSNFPTSQAATRVAYVDQKLVEYGACPS